MPAVRPRRAPAFALLGLLALAAGGCAPGAPPPARLTLGPPPALTALTARAAEPEPATLAVRLAAPARTLKALPAAWDVAVVRLTHPTALSAPRVRTLAKGVDLMPDGAGGYAAAAALGGPLRPAAGYTLDVELWQGAPATGALVAAKTLALGLVGGPNAVAVALDLLAPPLQLTGPGPAAGGWDDVVTLTGTGIDVATVTARLGGTAATLAGATATNVDARVPLLAPGTYAWEVTSAGRTVASPGFIVSPLVGAPVALSAVASHQTDPAVAAGATGFLAAWIDDRLVVKDDVLAIAIAPDATLPTPEAFVTEATSVTELRPAVAYDAARDRHLVAWQDGPGNSDIKACLVDPAGAPLAAAFDVVAGIGNQRNPRVAFDGVADAYMVAWHDPAGVTVQPVAGAGMVAGAPTLLAAGAAAVEPDVACVPAAGRHLVVWTDRAGADPKVCARLLDAAGAPVGPAFDVAATAGLGHDEAGVAADGAGGFLVTWVAQAATPEVRARRVATDGSLGAASVVSAAAGAKSYPRAAWAPWLGRYMVCWQQVGADKDAMGAYVAPDGAIWGEPFVVAAGVNDQARPEPAALAAASRVLVVYEEKAGAARRVMAQRVR